MSDQAPEVKSTDEEIKLYSQPDAPRVRRGTVKWLVPERFSQRQKSGLTALVKQGENTIDFQLRTGNKR